MNTEVPMLMDYGRLACVALQGDKLVTISRPLTANEWRSLDSIIASIRKSNPVSEFIPLSKDGPQTKR
jgi:hypothetical protein